MVESGEARSLSEVAEREGMDRAYVSRMVNLTTLAPDIVAALLDETLPPEVTLFDLASRKPLLWEDQGGGLARAWSPEIMYSRNRSGALTLTLLETPAVPRSSAGPEKLARWESVDARGT